MPTASDIIKAGQKALDDPNLSLVVAPAHYAWLARPRKEQDLTEVAISHALRVLRNEDVPPSGHRFTGSRVSGPHGADWSCHRHTLFAYAHAPKLAMTPVQLDNMHMGSDLHLGWQLEGLSAGWIQSCETWLLDDETSYGAKDDGILHDDSLLELKFTKGSKYEQIRKGARYGVTVVKPGPTPSNLYQITGLMWLRDIAYCSLVYVNRENGEFTEFRLARDIERENSLLDILADLNDWVEMDELPPMLPGCMAKSSAQYKNCEYRQHCPTARTVSLAVPEEPPVADPIDPVEL